MRARERPRLGADVLERDARVPRRPRATRSSSFWSTTMHAQRARTPAPRASRGSGRARPYDRPSRRRGRTTEAPATRAVGYGTSVPTAPLVTVLLAVHDGERVRPDRARERPRADGRRSRARRRRRRVDRRHAGDPRRASTTRGCACSATTSSSVSPRRSTADSTRRAGRYVARLDADDVAMPRRLERQLARLRAAPTRRASSARRCSSSTTRDASARSHAMPPGAAEVRWAALFSSPFFHPTVLVERDVLERHELRYDTSFDESEDYELWSRLLEVADGDNVPDPLVLYRVHPAQASQRRRELQRECQLRVARRDDRRRRARPLARRRSSSPGGSAPPSRSRPTRSQRRGRRVPRSRRRVRATARGRGARARAARDADARRARRVRRAIGARIGRARAAARSRAPGARRRSRVASAARARTSPPRGRGVAASGLAR